MLSCYPDLKGAPCVISHLHVQLKMHQLPQHPQSTTLDGLPKQFVTAMRTLFDIMDDKKSGYVRFSEIENRWQDDGTKGLPKGVLESLEKVTPPNGMLSFERFCAGLKICLLRNQAENPRNKPHPDTQQSQPTVPPPPPQRPPSAPLLDMDTQVQPQMPPWSTNMAAVRPQHRAISMPQLVPDSRNEPDPRNYNVEKPVPLNTTAVKPVLYGPPKPPRTAAGLLASRDSYPGVNPVVPNVYRSVPVDREGRLDKAEIRTALHNWQMALMAPDKRQVFNSWSGRCSGDGKSTRSGVSTAQTTPPAVPPPNRGQDDPSNGIGHKKTTGRRREPRRHTLQNGIDYNMLKRMKQIEQEKDTLMQGLQAVDRAREWYLKQVAAVTEKIKYLGRMGSHMEPWSETQQERLELQRARVLEINRHLAALTEGGERGGFPLHINLAVNASGAQSAHAAHAAQAAASRLRQQNLVLTEEVNKKTERITALEREKAALLRELYHRSETQNESGFV